MGGINAAAAQFLQNVDIAPGEILRFSDWSSVGLEALMMARLPVVSGNASGTGPLSWLANPELVVAAQQHWPPNTLIPAIVLPHQIAERTCHIATVGWMFAASAPPLSRAISSAAMHRLWLATIEAGINPLSTENKMNLVRTIKCDPRKLPAARPAASPNSEAAA